jgi:hypothetical protein
MANLATCCNNIIKQTPLMLKYQFTVEFINGASAYAAGLLGGDVDEQIAYWAQSANIPSFEVVKGTTAFYGTEFRVPTTIKYEHDWTLKFLLDQDLTIYERMRTWLRSFSNLKQSGGGEKIIPDCNMRINLLDPAQQTITQAFVLVGCWPTNIGEFKLEYKQDDTTAMTFECKIKYQYCYPAEDQLSSGDPLAANGR